MSKNLIYIGIGILAIIAVFLGYKIYQQQASFKQIASQTKPTPTVQVQQSSQPQDSSAEENLIKAAPPQDASEQDRTAYYQKLQGLAKDAATIEITNCTLNPLIIRTKEGTVLSIKNNDGIEHTVVSGTDKLKVPANGMISTKIGLFNKFISFSCTGGTQGLLIQ